MFSTLHGLGFRLTRTWSNQPSLSRHEYCQRFYQCRCVCVYVYIYIYIYIHIYKEKLLLREYLPFNPSAETALLPLIWCFESLYSQWSFFFGGVFFHWPALYVCFVCRKRTTSESYPARTLLRRNRNSLMALEANRTGPMFVSRKYLDCLNNPQTLVNRTLKYRYSLLLICRGLPAGCPRSAGNGRTEE